MTVAIALLSVQAMAIAPVITDIPSVVVGNQATVSQPVRYVYIDAFDLNTSAYDDNTSTVDLKWSYDLGNSTPKFSINGNAPLTGTDDPVNPPVTKQIAGTGSTVNNLTGAANYAGQDGFNNTVTIRNIALFPYGGTASTDQTAGAQDWFAANNYQPITFWCSDGNQATAKQVIFWTDNHYNNGSPIGVQKLSRSQPPFVPLKNDNLVGGGGNKLWHAFDKEADGTFYDHCTSHTMGGVGVCFNVTATGTNFGSVQSPMPYFTMTQNTVYRIRCTMNGSQSGPGTTPLWDFLIENWDGYPEHGLNLYGMDSFYVDNEGGANTVVSSSNGQEITMYWAPTAFATPQWTNATTGLWAMDTSVTPNVPKYAGKRDPALRFRVLDVDGNAALKNDVKAGDICLQKVVVDSISYNNCVVDQANIVNITQPDGPKMVNVGTPPVSTLDPGNMICTGVLGSTAAYTTGTPGYVTITPSSAGQSTELVEIAPATDLSYHFPSADTADNWPIPWQSDKIYRLRVTMDAPDANSAASPWDVMWLSMEPPTNEILTESYLCSVKGIGSLKTVPAAGQTYTFFYYSGKETKSTVNQAHFLRWRVRFGNNTALNFPNASNLTNTGKIRLYTVVVDTVKFQ